jgi:hypothetical protein
LEAGPIRDTLAAAMIPQRIAALFLLALVSACGSPGSASQPPADPKDPRANRSEAISDEDWNQLKPDRPHGDPLALRFTDFRSNRRLALVNESHTDPTDQYSQKRKLEDSMTKVGHDEVVAALVERFEEHGFFKLAQGGAGPASGAGTWTVMLEIERKDGLHHMALSSGSSAKEREVFGLCQKDFVTIYSGILGLQAVEGQPIPTPKH